MQYTCNTDMLETTIKLSIKTKQRLSNLGKKGMTFDEIINHLLDQIKQGNNQ